MKPAQQEKLCRTSSYTLTLPYLGSTTTRASEVNILRGAIIP